MKGGVQQAQADQGKSDQGNALFKTPPASLAGRLSLVLVHQEA